MEPAPPPAVHGVLAAMGSDANWVAEKTVSAGSFSLYLPLPFLFDDMVWEGLSGEVTLDIHPTGTMPAEVTCTGIEFVVATDRITAADRQSSVALHRTSIVTKGVIEYVRTQYHNRTLTAGTSAFFDLDSFGGGLAG